MPQCHWEEINEFRSPSEYSRFRKWMEKQVSKGMSKPTEVEKYYAGENLSESWYVCADCETIWRLVEPDPGYFNGVFCIVT